MSSLTPAFFRFCWICLLIQSWMVAQQVSTERVPETRPLEMKVDIASELVAGADRFLLGELRQSIERRGPYWHRDFSSYEANQKSIVRNRQQLTHVLGLRKWSLRSTGRYMARANRPECVWFAGTVRRCRVGGQGGTASTDCRSFCWANGNHSGGRGALARIVSPQVEDVRREAERAKRLFAGSGMSTNLELVISEEGHGPYGADHALASFLKGIDGNLQLQPSRSDPENLYAAFDPQTRHAQQVHELDRHTQYLLRESHYV